MKTINYIATILIGILLFSQLLSCGKGRSLSPEEAAFKLWAEETCLAWAKSFNGELDRGNRYRILPDECIEFYRLLGGHLPVVVSSLQRYENEVVNGDRKVVVHLNMFDAEMALRWQNKMINSIRYPNPVRDVVLQAVMADAYRQMNQNLQNTDTEAYKLRIPDQNYFPVPTPQASQPNPPSTVCPSCNGTGRDRMACASCGGTGIQQGFRCGACSGQRFMLCITCSGKGNF
jgi:hypothetical protein